MRLHHLLTAIVIAGLALPASALGATAVTGTAQQVTPTAAVMTGTVNPGGVETRYFFQYGRTAAYGSVVPSRSAGNGNRPVAVRAAVSQLTPNTTYHYRVV